jgi:hypothetical protein
VMPQRHCLHHTFPHEAHPPLLLTMRSPCLAPAGAALRVLPVLPRQAAAAAPLPEHLSGPAHNSKQQQESQSI